MSHAISPTEDFLVQGLLREFEQRVAAEVEERCGGIIRDNQQLRMDNEVLQHMVGANIRFKITCMDLDGEFVPLPPDPHIHLTEYAFSIKYQCLPFRSESRRGLFDDQLNHALRKAMLVIEEELVKKVFIEQKAGEITRLEVKS